jgi:hypothetical protein
MWETRHPETIKSSIFEEMRKLGANYAEAHYSGGNDEGGVESLDLFRDIPGEDDKTERIKVAVPDSEHFGWEHPLWRDFDDLLSLEFGTWAGDFTAFGTVIADLRENKITRSGEMSHYESDGDEW